MHLILIDTFLKDLTISQYMSMQTTQLIGIRTKHVSIRGHKNILHCRKICFSVAISISSTEILFKVFILKVRSYICK